MLPDLWCSPEATKTCVGVNFGISHQTSDNNIGCFSHAYETNLCVWEFEFPFLLLFFSLGLEDEYVGDHKGWGDTVGKYGFLCGIFHNIFYSKNWRSKSWLKEIINKLALKWKWIKRRSKVSIYSMPTFSMSYIWVLQILVKLSIGSRLSSTSFWSIRLRL